MMMPRYVMPPPADDGDAASDDGVVPDGSKDIKEISQLQFIEMFLSGKMSFPPDQKIYYFGPENLREIEMIGTGTFGRVFKMKHDETNKIMAVKKIRVITSMTEGMNSMKRLQTEVEANRVASHCEQIVQMFGVTFHEGDCWVCMELMDVSLEKAYRAIYGILKDTHFDEIVLGAVAVSTIRALDHLKQSHDIIHRDVKPSNILLDIRGRVKLCDFGISGYLVDSIAETREAGCRPYMAPERLKNIGRGYDIRSDVWSFGITMIEVGSGQLAYPDFMKKPIFLQLSMVVNGDAPILRNSHYSAQTINFINSCVVKDVADRPTFQQLIQTAYFAHHSRIIDRAHHADYVDRILRAIRL